jgi:predicted MFS family arabinose efflux permease
MSIASQTQGSLSEVRLADRRVALGLLMAAYMLSVTDRMILSVLFDPIKAEFTLTNTQLGLLGGLTFSLFYATLGVPLAKYADRNDRRRLIAACLILFSFMTAMSGLATGFLMLIIFRTLVGVGEAGVNPASQSMVADYYPPHQRSLAMSVLTAGGNLGMIFGFLAGGLVSQAYGWRAAFFVVGMPGVLLGFALLLFLKEPRRGGADSKATSANPANANIKESVRTMFASPILRQLLAASTVSGMVTYGVLQWLPAYFGRVHELEQGKVGIVMALFIGVIGAAGTLAGGRLTDVLTKRRVDLGVKMIALTQLGMIPLFALGYMSGSLTISLAILTLPFFMLSFFLGPSLALIQTYAPVQMRSLAAAIKMLCLNLVGLSLGPLIVGVITDLLEPSQGPRALATALSCVALFSAWSATHFWLAGRSMLDYHQKASLGASAP